MVPYTSSWPPLAAQTLDANDALVMDMLSNFKSELGYLLVLEWAVTLADALGAVFNESVKQRAYCGCFARLLLEFYSEQKLLVSAAEARLSVLPKSAHMAPQSRLQVQPSVAIE